MEGTPGNTATGENSRQYLKRQLIDIGALGEPTGKRPYSHPNVFSGQNDLFKFRMTHQLILSGIITTRL